MKKAVQLNVRSYWLCDTTFKKRETNDFEC